MVVAVVVSMMMMMMMTTTPAGLAGGSGPRVDPGEVPSPL